MIYILKTIGVNNLKQGLHMLIFTPTTLKDYVQLIQTTLEEMEHVLERGGPQGLGPSLNLEKIDQGTIGGVIGSMEILPVHHLPLPLQRLVLTKTNVGIGIRDKMESKIEIDVIIIVSINKVIGQLGIEAITTTCLMMMNP